MCNIRDLGWWNTDSEDQTHINEDNASSDSRDYEYSHDGSLYDENFHDENFPHEVFHHEDFHDEIFHDWSYDETFHNASDDPYLYD